MIRMRWLNRPDSDIGQDFLRPTEGLGELLAERGVRVVNDDSYDVSWGTQRERGTPGRPHIMHEIRDSGAIVWQARRAGRSATLLVKPQRYRDFSLHNGDHFETTVHGAVCWQAAQACERPEGCPAPLEPPVPADLGNRIRLGWNWLFFPGMESCANLPLATSRDRDVVFAGTMTYGRWHITWHRGKMGAQLPRLPGNNEFHGRRVFPRPEFHRWLTRSRIVVSPWGYGETCIRDIEGLLAGCVLIKPDTPWVETWPEYHHFPNCLACRADFSDLYEVATKALDCWKELAPKCLEVASTLRAMRSPSVLANRISSLVAEAVELGPARSSDA
jgi:hypothetical protein